MELKIESGINLKIVGTGPAVKPFFSYDFYTFEARSRISQGTNPLFNSSKQYQVENTAQFRQYMETQVLVIDLIDEAVDISRPGARDYIGSVRVPLREALVKGQIMGTFPVIDENRAQNGELRLQISLMDAPSFDESQLLGEESRMAQTSPLQQEIVRKIVSHFVGNSFDDFDEVLNTLFMKVNASSGKVSKGILKEFLLENNNIPGLTEKDLEVLFKTHSHLISKEVLTKQDLTQVFQTQFTEAQMRLHEELTQ